MTLLKRKLNDQGIYRFREYLAGATPGAPPSELLSAPDTSEPLAAPIDVASAEFPNRYEFGRHLVHALSAFNAAEISNDRGLWSALALHWFDALCPPKGANGSRRPDREYRYILSADFRHYYRHLVRSPWRLVYDHAENARCLLIGAQERKHPLSIGGEILEQIGSRQNVLSSRSIIEAVDRLYFDSNTGRAKRGVAGQGAGSARRLATVLRQLDLTYDPDQMPDAGLLSILPAEFNRWIKG